MMGVREVYKEQADKSLKATYCGYTRDHYFEVEDGVLKKWEAHSLGDIPIFEYRLNMARMGSFEPAVPLLDAINTIITYGRTCSKANTESVPISTSQSMNRRKGRS